ncbi:SsgA family sporulation/cell division regulator [Streptomyces sp. NPDC005262]|uniref:SsgA family sporulation/cell division regulator n=1 Tax=Streptomyces sp. NPDC005262 TaxID=3364710 RepID=UPI00369F43E4
MVQELSARLVVSHDYSLPMCMRLRYEPTDPYVIRADFFAHGDDPVEWVLGRDLLIDGLRDSAGYGNVRIWPAAGRGDQAMHIALGSSAGTALLEVPVQDVKSFLKNTEALVPLGTEPGRIDWGIELANLLAEH